jgi:hypothetical protein
MAEITVHLSIALADRYRSWADMAGTPTLVVVQGFFSELRAKLKR